MQVSGFPTTFRYQLTEVPRSKTTLILKWVFGKPTRPYSWRP